MSSIVGGGAGCSVQPRLEINRIREEVSNIPRILKETIEGMNKFKNISYSKRQTITVNDFGGSDEEYQVRLGKKPQVTFVGPDAEQNARLFKELDPDTMTRLLGYCLQKDLETLREETVEVVVKILSLARKMPNNDWATNSMGEVTTAEFHDSWPEAIFKAFNPQNLIHVLKFALKKHYVALDDEAKETSAMRQELSRRVNRVADHLDKPHDDIPF